MAFKQKVSAEGKGHVPEKDPIGGQEEKDLLRGHTEKDPGNVKETEIEIVNVMEGKLLLKFDTLFVLKLFLFLLFTVWFL